MLFLQATIELATSELQLLLCSTAEYFNDIPQIIRKDAALQQQQYNEYFHDELSGYPTFAIFLVFLHTSCSVCNA